MNPCNCIALYDWNPETTNLQGWFHYMERWADQVRMPWGSIGITTSQKLIQFKTGKRKLEQINFKDVTEIELMGGVIDSGTNEGWKSYASLSCKKQSCRNVSEFCFANSLIPFEKSLLLEFLKDLLAFSNFQYGICYQRPFNKGPSSYAGGAIETYGNLELPQVERSQITAWMHEYNFKDGKYRTGLLRDVYPFNIFVATHLIQEVSDTTLEAWIDADPNHGSLEKITDKHWLWSIDPDHIPAAQETLQEAGLLLCYKV